MDWLKIVQETWGCQISPLDNWNTVDKTPNKQTNILPAQVEI